LDLATATVDELFALARAAQDEDAYWETVSELHRRVEERTFKLAEVLCESILAGERCLGADVLSQLGATAGASAADSPFAPAARDVLRAVLVDETEPAVLSSAAVGLGHLHDERAIPVLAQLASHAHPLVRRGAVHGLMGHDDDRAVAALIALSADPDGEVRDWATFSLGVQIERDRPELRDALAARLGDDHGDTHGEAIRGLARRGDERALDAVLEAPPSPAIDEAILLLAASTADRRLCPHIERMLADPRAVEAWGDEIDRALERCTGGGAG
jgi:HEAT repeat protein